MLTFEAIRFPDAAFPLIFSIVGFVHAGLGDIPTQRVKGT